MVDTKKNHIPQAGERLKQLRESKNQNQSELANLLQTLLKPYMRPGFVVQQPDISKLEHEETSLDIPELLAYAQLFDVDIAFLLKPHFRALCRSEMRLKRFATDELADQYLCQQESEGRLLTFSHFPSSYFIRDENSKRSRQIAQSHYEETHLYALDAFLNFIFSPISRNSNAQKIAILEKYLNHFRGNFFKRLRFFSRIGFPSTTNFPNFELLQNKSTLLMLAPIMQKQGDAFLEIHDETICQEVFDFYFCQLNILDADLTLVRIGMETLERLQKRGSMESAIRFFYQELATRNPEDKEAVLENFSEDMQVLLKT